MCARNGSMTKLWEGNSEQPLFLYMWRVYLFFFQLVEHPFVTVILWSKFIAQEKADFRWSIAEARPRKAWAGRTVHIPFRVCSSWCNSSCKPPLGVVNIHPDIVKICWLAPVVFSLRIGEVFHVKSSCLMWFDLAVFIISSPSHLTVTSASPALSWILPP